MTVTSAKAPRMPNAAVSADAAVTDLASMSPDAARRLAADLAPHLIAMRAVTAGTSFDDNTGAMPSPATTIFIAGMLARLSASA